MVIQGDLNSPTVTSLPGVTPSYGVMSRAAQTPVGFVYASGDHGLWAWNGGNVSQKISEALEDNFFVNEALVGNLNPAAQIYRGPTVDIVPWGDWIVVTNDWVMDTNTGGWWQLGPVTGGTPHLWYGTSWDGNSLYASIAVPTNEYFMDVYSRTSPSTSWVWESYPIRIGTDAKNVNYLVKEVVVRAQGLGTIAVNVTGILDSTSVGLSSPVADGVLTYNSVDDNSQPAMKRLTMGLVAQDVTIEIAAQGADENTPAPILYSIAIGYEEQNPVSPG